MHRLFSRDENKTTSKEELNTLPKGTCPVLSTEELLSPHLPLLRKIKELAGVPAAHYYRLYQPALINYARFVQQLPASEAHHHAGPGGLLKHGLDVVATALTLRRGYLLPQGAEPEQLTQKQDLWNYAVFTAALSHDLAKPAVDQIVTLYSENSDLPSRWEPWSHFIDERARCYQVDFVRQKPYRLHERASLLLIHKILPPEGVAWLASDHEVLSCWLACMGGDIQNDAGALGEIVHKADGDSVSRNLGAEPGERFPTARTKPLHEKLLTGLRYLLNEGELPLNRNGAAGWLTNDDLWLVSKRTIDALRNQLVKEGHSGIPTKNDRIFDILQEHRILIPNCDRAIWRAAVKGDDWKHELTLIRISTSKIWTNPDHRPDAFRGEVIPLDVTSGNQGNVIEPIESSNEQKVNRKPGGEVSQQMQHSEQEPLSNHNALHQSSDTNDEVSTNRSEKSTNLNDYQNHHIGNHFLAWLRENIVNKNIQVNNARAKIHVVPEGLLLISPSVFKEFVTCTEVDATWESVQKKFLKLNLHQKTATGLNIHKYKITGKNRSSFVNGILMPDLSVIFDAPYPKSNPYLSLSLECKSNTH